MSLLEIKHLKKYFKVAEGQLHAVDDVSLTLNRGETLGIVGESGCGKSTLGRTILRLTEPDGGEILYNGKDIAKSKAGEMKRLRQELQIIFQDPYASLNPRMTVSQVISEPLKLHGIVKGAELDQRVFRLMETVGLSERLVNAYPHELDGGRRQRVCIARALALEPKIIVCDEPVSALDVSIQAQILNLLMDLQDELGISYLFITHNLSVVKHISDHIAVMYLGQVVEYAPTEELFLNPRHPYTRALLSAIPVPDIAYRDKPIEILQGELKSPVDPKPGCRFLPRCKFAESACGVDCEWTECTPGHFVACNKCKTLKGEK